MMAVSTALSLGSVLWMGVSLALVAMATQLCLAWMEHAFDGHLRARMMRWLAAGVSLGTGIWATHGVGASVETFMSGVGYRPGAELAVWLLSVGACTAAFALSDLRRSQLPKWLLATGCLGTAVVGSQMMGLLAGDWRSDLVWRYSPLLQAWALCTVAAAMALGLTRWSASKDPGSLAIKKAAASLCFATAVVVAAHLVALAAVLPSPGGASDLGRNIPGNTLTAIALLGTGAALLALRRLLGTLVESRNTRRALVTRHLSDPLTGLPTMQRFEGSLAQAVKLADAHQQRLALLVISIDGLQSVNHLLGPTGGDRVIREVASRVKLLSKPHMAARLADDEFLSLLTENPQPKDASAFASALVAEIGRPCTIDGREVALSCSIGVCMYPDHGAMSALIAHARAAMSTARAAGGDGHAFYEPRMLRGPREDAELLRDLRLALERGQFELYYQPKIHAPSGEITGAEALIRWNHPQRGMVSPGLFIPLAERYGLINAIGQWVIDEACGQVRTWRDGGLRMRVAINLSTHQLRQPDLTLRIGNALQRHQINPNLITCEITETSAMEDTEVTTRVLGELDAAGLHISIDDFGTGHSSLSYLRKLPADELKIDRSFVLELETSEDARKVASAVINLAKALNLKVVAEGVETEGQYGILRELGCDQLQGFLFAKPMSGKALTVWAMEDVGPRTMNFRASLFKDTVAIECA